MKGVYMFLNPFVVTPYENIDENPNLVEKLYNFKKKLNSNAVQDVHLNYVVNLDNPIAIGIIYNFLSEYGKYRKGKQNLITFLF